MALRIQQVSLTQPEIRGTPDVGLKAPERPRWCDQIPTPAENQLSDRVNYRLEKRASAGRWSHFCEAIACEGPDAKRIQILQDLVSGASKIALLVNPGNQMQGLIVAE